jgi:UDP-N-acetyl-D-glucosamine dehydrogenase
MEKLIKKIEEEQAEIGIIGMGYVGLPLAVEFARSGLHVTGIDIDTKRVEEINSGKSYIQDTDSEELSLLVKNGRLKATDDFSVLASLDTVSICVPTPLRKTKDPDISFIVSSTEEILKYLHKGQLIVLESTTYPGTTDEIILPRLESSGLKVGKDFFLAFSPERVDPGNKKYTTKNTPKIIGGVTESCTRVARALYEKAIDRVVTVSSSGSAEMVKLLENTFRAVNIALVNEVVLMCNRLKINVWEVIEAAATKPFGFMPFYPGPGLGGHCIPIDPHYLSWKLKTLNYKARFIELASEINAGMPFYVVEKIGDVLNSRQKSIKGSKVMVLGVTYKKDINDVRESPALDIINILYEKGASIFFNDPYIRELDGYNEMIEFTEINVNSLKEADCVVIVTDHTAYDYSLIVEHSPVVIDTRNATKNVNNHREKIISL